MAIGADFGVSSGSDFGEAIRKRIAKLVKSEVLVGIPASTTERKESDAPTNAMIGYVQNYGKPALNIPARPFMEPGIENAQDQISSAFKAAAIAGMENRPDAMEAKLNQAGLAAQASIQQKITDGPFQALSPRTMAARRRKYKKRGTEPPDKPLMESDQLRASITYVIREK